MSFTLLITVIICIVYLNYMTREYTLDDTQEREMFKQVQTQLLCFKTRMFLESLSCNRHNEFEFTKICFNNKNNSYFTCIFL